MTGIDAAYRTFVQFDRPAEGGEALWITGASNIPGLIAESSDLATLYDAVDVAGSVLVWTNIFHRMWPQPPQTANLGHEVIVMDGDKVTERKVLLIDLNRAKEMVGA